MDGHRRDHNWQCDCECHTNRHIVHCAPCCQICPECGARVKHGAIWMKAHQKNCSHVPIERHFKTLLIS